MTGKELRGLLKYNNVNLSQLADRCGISHQTLDSRLKAKSIKKDFWELINSKLDNPLNPISSEQGSEFDSPSKLNEIISQVTKPYLDQISDLRKRVAELTEEVKGKDLRIKELTDILIQKNA